MRKLYIIWNIGEEDFEEELRKTEQILRCKVDFIQYRNKVDSFSDSLKKLQALKMTAQRYHTPIIVNDDYRLLQRADVEGLHIGQEDGEVDWIREKIGTKKILGVTAKTTEQAIFATVQGADYLGVGAIFSSLTKPEAKSISIEIIQKIRQSVKTPIYFIGGITPDNVEEKWLKYGDGIVVSNCIYQSSEREKTIEKLKEKMNG